MLASVWNARPADIYGFSGITQERNKTLLAIGKLVAEVAKICNFTPFVSPLDEIKSGKVDPSTFNGFIIPFVAPKIVAPYYYPLDKTRGEIFLAVYQYFNFVYCDLDHDIQTLNFNLLLQPFDVWIWTWLIVGAFLVTFGLWLPAFKSRPWSGLGRAVFMTISGIFSDTIHDTSKKNTIILLWLVLCFIFNNLYSGVLTSLLIAPVEKDVIDTVDEAADRKYHFVYTEAGFFKTILFMTKVMAANSQTNSSLQILTKTIEMKETLPGLIQSVAFGSHTILFAPFLLIMQYWTMLTEMNEQRFKKTRKVKHKRFCHMGKELSSTYSIPETWVILMNQQEGKPNSAQILRLLYHLDANGIHPYWMHFFFRIQGANRAQDLTRFKSKTEAFVEVPIEPLAFYKGSISTIFALYGICIIIAVIAFGGELCWKSAFLHNYF